MIATAKTIKLRKMGYWTWVNSVAKKAFVGAGPGKIIDVSETYWRPLFNQGLSVDEAIQQYWKDKVKL